MVDRLNKINIGAWLVGGSILFALVPSVSAAELFLFPNSLLLQEGETGVVELRLDTESETIAAAEISGALSGPVSIDSLSTSGGLVDIWVEEKVNGTTFKLVGGTPRGFNGSGIVARIVVRATGIGIGELTLDPNSKLILLSDEATLVQTNLGSASIQVASADPSQIHLSSRTHPDQNQWYPSRKINIHWGLEEGVEYSYSVDNLPNAALDDVADFPEGTLEWLGDVEFTAPSDGIFYFSVKRVGESSISRYRVMIDTERPRWLNLALSEGQDFPGQPSGEYISFVAKDDLSGIDRYEISVDEGQFMNAISPQLLPSGYKNITLRAYDQAGNYVEHTISKDRGIMLVIITLSILLALLIIFNLRRRKGIKGEKTS